MTVPPGHFAPGDSADEIDAAYQRMLLACISAAGLNPHEAPVAAQEFIPRMINSVHEMMEAVNDNHPDAMPFVLAALEASLRMMRSRLSLPGGEVPTSSSESSGRTGT